MHVCWLTFVRRWRTPKHDDPQLVQLFEGFNEFAVINQTGTAVLIDSFPLLRWLPNSILPTQAKARQLHKIEKELYLGHWLKAKNSIKDGTARPCLCVDMAKTQESEGFSDDQAAYISGTLLEAGSDTTSSTLYAFVQAMLLFPEVQQKAQEELDRVVGKGRLPTMDDEPNLQYIRGCVKETLRWMPTTILGAVPHAAIKDDEYMGYKIPAAAGILNNVYTINMDPKRFPDPRRFNPDRYANDFQSLAEAASNPNAALRDQFTFGAGRRICVGMHVAQRSLFLGMSRMLWTFEIRPAVDDATGEEIIPDADKLTQGFVCMPVPYRAKITARSEERAEMVKKEWEDAQRSLDPRTKQWVEVPGEMDRSSEQM